MQENYEYAESIQQGCVVEEIDYCETRMENDPAIYHCEVKIISIF